MRVVDSELMKAIDRVTIEKKGIPGLTLMEKAGEGVASVVKRLFPCEVYGRILIVCGRGNNGGDGFVVGRLLSECGYRVTGVLLARQDEVRGDALVNLEKYVERGLALVEAGDEEDVVSVVGKCLKDSDCVIDGIFGTGLAGEIRGSKRDVIECINGSGIPVVAVDASSGLDCTSGKILGVCVRADVTVTMALPKRGQLVYPGRGYTGRLEVVDIGVPEDVEESYASGLFVETLRSLREKLPKRRPESHKGDCGRLLIVAGSPGLTGAAALAGDAALRSGAGLVTVGTPESLNPILEVKLTEVMTLPLPETISKTLSMKALEPILNFAASADAAAIGPGLSTNTETVSLVRGLVTRLNLPIVVDADGLNALAGSVELLKAKKAVITPHPGEMARLIGSSISKVLAAPEEISKELATTLGIVVILKGAPSIIASPTGDIFYNASGNPGMATGGTGDVLTGMIGGFLAQGCSLLDAALLGVYMHGLSGDIAFRHYGTCLAACDLIDCIPDAFIELLEAEAGDNGGINELILNLYWLKHPLIDTYR